MDEKAQKELNKALFTAAKAGRGVMATARR